MIRLRVRGPSRLLKLICGSRVLHNGSRNARNFRFYLRLADCFEWRKETRHTSSTSKLIVDWRRRRLVIVTISCFRMLLTCTAPPGTWWQRCNWRSSKRSSSGCCSSSTCKWTTAASRRSESSNEPARTWRTKRFQRFGKNVRSTQGSLPERSLGTVSPPSLAGTGCQLWTGTVNENNWICLQILLTIDNLTESQIQIQNERLEIFV